VGAIISAAQKQLFDEQGYLTVRGLLSAEADIAAFRRAYSEFIDTLAGIMLREHAVRSEYAGQPFAEQFATLVGHSGGRVLHHIDPNLQIFEPGYRRMKELPSAQRPELFHLMRHERLLDALEVLLGPEITASPIYHFNLKLPRPQFQRAAEMATAAGHKALPRYDFNVGTTIWHTDTAYGLPDARHSRIVNAWIPITAATGENGCLLVAPGSHRLEPKLGSISPDATANATPLTVEPGDVVFLHNNILHASQPNRSVADIRWAFNFRYLPTGELTGRPYLPEFVARSRRAPERELRSAALWSEMWQAALDYLSDHPPGPQFGRTLPEAQAITAQWRAATPDYDSWLRLAGPLPSSARSHVAAQGAES
jgi:ectoine hydroxylase-related dioxygenase (phytanoyl-CoA dioxygenase family)